MNFRIVPPKPVDLNLTDLGRQLTDTREKHSGLPTEGRDDRHHFYPSSESTGMRQPGSRSGATVSLRCSLFTAA
jgi:hypothetical protein